MLKLCSLMHLSLLCLIIHPLVITPADNFREAFCAANNEEAAQVSLQQLLNEAGSTVQFELNELLLKSTHPCQAKALMLAGVDINAKHTKRKMRNIRPMLEHLLLRYPEQSFLEAVVHSSHYPFTMSDFDNAQQRHERTIEATSLFESISWDDKHVIKKIIAQLEAQIQQPKTDVCCTLITPYGTESVYGQIVVFQDIQKALSDITKSHPKGRGLSFFRDAQAYILGRQDEAIIERFFYKDDPSFREALLQLVETIKANPQAMSIINEAEQANQHRKKISHLLYDAEEKYAACSLDNIPMEFKEQVTAFLESDPEIARHRKLAMRDKALAEKQLLIIQHIRILAQQRNEVLAQQNSSEPE